MGERVLGASGPVDTPIDSQRAMLAASLYNNVHRMLVEGGWTEELEQDPFWPKGKPTGTWRHKEHPGAWTMDAAFVCCAQRMPRRG
jgi:hypothetical protein